ncbi:hypothetical protein [Escherichia coli]|uniref:hypothetical protein n=1 Tax=Escherichia coli TaxID=562 RepID=UPI003D1ED275
MNRSIITIATTGVLLPVVQVACAQDYELTRIDKEKITFPNYITGFATIDKVVGPDGRLQVVGHPYQTNTKVRDMRRLNWAVNHHGGDGCEALDNGNIKISLNKDGAEVYVMNHDLRPNVNSGGEGQLRDVMADKIHVTYTPPRYLRCRDGNAPEVTREMVHDGKVYWWTGSGMGGDEWHMWATGVYRPVANRLEMSFRPSTITLQGRVGSDIDTTATLNVTTGGTQRVVVTWPSVMGVKYQNNDQWGNESTDDVIVESQASIQKTIKISGGLGVGGKSIAIAVTGEIM